MIATNPTSAVASKRPQGGDRTAREATDGRARTAPIQNAVRIRLSAARNGVELTCWECRFFRADDGVDRDRPPVDECEAGECRRRPPVTDHGCRDAKANWAEFPMVMACEWCGDFLPRPATLPQKRAEEANSAFDVASHDKASQEPTTRWMKGRDQVID